jgi:hypothetical protein
MDTGAVSYCVGGYFLGRPFRRPSESNTARIRFFWPSVNIDNCASSVLSMKFINIAVGVPGQKQNKPAVFISCHRNTRTVM